MGKKVSVLVLVVGCLTLRPDVRAGERPFVFNSIDFPGAILTQASGINAGDEIVGFYRDTTGKNQGFVLTGGAFSTIDFPGAVANSAARGIVPAGDIVGTYQNPGEPPVIIHGYLLTRGGQFFRVDYPGHLNTIAQRIAPDGTILGCYHDADQMGTMHGIVVAHEGPTEFAVPASMHTGSTPNGKTIAGLYTTGGRTRGYLLDNGNFIPFDVPGSTFTQAWDINPAGDTVGVYRDAAGKVHGFMVENWTFTTIDFPGATATNAFGINAGGDVVGSYVISGQTHGFLASRTQR